MKIKSSRLFKIIALFICFSMLFEQSGFAQIAGQLDISLHLSAFRNSLAQDKFRPLHLRYLSYDSLKNNFKLLLDKGDLKQPQAQELEESTQKLLNYFFVGVSLPNESFWVNLRPDSPDNIIDPELAKTEIGKIFLEADLELKKDTANYTNPQTLEGKQYWAKLYQKAEEIFGYENIIIPTLTRPWIVPGEIIIRETSENAYIYKATLKVMLEQDYLKDSATYNFTDARLKALNEYSSQLIRELIIPKLTKEINNAKKYAPLRQVYYSLILAQWFKQKYYGKGGLYSWLIDKKSLNGLTAKIPYSQNTYFKAYQESFSKGEYNLKEPQYTPYGQTMRSYFSGGIALQGVAGVVTSVASTRVSTSNNTLGNLPEGFLKKCIPVSQQDGSLPDLPGKISVDPVIVEKKIEVSPVAEDVEGGVSIKPPKEAMLQIVDFIAKTAEGTVKFGGYQEGALVDLRALPADKEVIIVGDAHARLENINLILGYNGNREKILSGKAVLVILGDALHPELNLLEGQEHVRLFAAGDQEQAAVQMQEVLSRMKASIAMMQLIMDLKIQAPQNVYWVLGDHEYPTADIFKGREDIGVSVHQGAEFRKALINNYGQEYVRNYEEFIRAGAVAVVCNGAVAVHGGPAAGVNLEAMRNQDASLLSDTINFKLMMGRYGGKKGFNQGEIDIFLTAMGQPNGVLISGHNPLEAENWHWNITPNYHIVFAAHERVGYAVVQNGQVSFREATDPTFMNKIVITPEEWAKSGSERKRPDGYQSIQAAVEEAKALGVDYKQLNINWQRWNEFVDKVVGAQAVGLTQREAIAMAAMSRVVNHMLRLLIAEKKQLLVVKDGGNDISTSVKFGFALKIGDRFESSGGDSLRIIRRIEGDQLWTITFKEGKSKSEFDLSQANFLTMVKKGTGKVFRISEKRPLVGANVALMMSEVFRDFANFESFGGPGREGGFVQVNGVMTKDGHILAFGNIQDLRGIKELDVDEGLKKGELFDFGIKYKLPGVSKDTRSPDYQLTSVDNSYGQPIPLLAVQVLATSVNIANEQKAVSSQVQSASIASDVDTLRSLVTQAGLESWADIASFVISKLPRTHNYDALRSLLLHISVGRLDSKFAGVPEDKVNSFIVEQKLPLEQAKILGLAMGLNWSQGAGVRRGSEKSVDISTIESRKILQRSDAGIVVDAQALLTSGQVTREELIAVLRLLEQETFGKVDPNVPWEKVLTTPGFYTYVFVDNDGSISGFSRFTADKGIAYLSRIGTKGRSERQQGDPSKHRGTTLSDAFFAFLKEQRIKTAWWVVEESEPRAFYSSYLDSRGISYSRKGNTYIVDVDSVKLPQPGFTEDKSTGGINFTALPIVTQMDKNLGTAPLYINAPLVRGQSPARIVPLSASLEKEWRGIKQTLNGGIVPSNERIKEYILGVCASGNFGPEFDKILSCIADILRLEEERCNFTAPALKEILMLLESDKSAQEVQLALTALNVDQKALEVIIE